MFTVIQIQKERAAAAAAHLVKDVTGEGQFKVPSRFPSLLDLLADDGEVELPDSMQLQVDYSPFSNHIRHLR